MLRSPLKPLLRDANPHPEQSPSSFETPRFARLLRMRVTVEGRSAPQDEAQGRLEAEAELITRKAGAPQCHSGSAAATNQPRRARASRHQPCEQQIGRAHV